MISAVDTPSSYEHTKSGSTKDIGGAVLAFVASQPPYDAFEDMLPFMLSDGSPERPEPRFDQLEPGRTQRKYIVKMGERDTLVAEGKITTGTKVFILHSDIGEKVKTITRNDKQVEVRDYFHSPREAHEHLSAARGLKHTIETTMGHDPSQIELAEGRREAIDEAIIDPEVGHIIFIGHANRSQLTIDPIYTYNWQETPPLTHLKKSFGVFGCAALKNDRYYPRIGSTFVDPNGVLYGVPTDFLETGQPYSFDQLVRQPLEVLEGTPFKPLDKKAS